MTLNVLIINSYAGSLTVGMHTSEAATRGLTVRGIYEDAGFGLSVQRANFPHLAGLMRETTRDWPAHPDLTDTIVLAHPPCSAFSSQTPKAKKGVESDAFACTKRVLRYAMQGKAPAIAVESVPATLAGGAVVHERYAQRYGYHLYRVLQNAVSFGVPQWRPRFWAVFVRKDAAAQGMYWAIPRPARYTTVRDVLEDAEPGPVLPAVQRHFDRQLQELESLLGWSAARTASLLAANFGRLHSILASVLGIPASAARERYCTPKGHDSWVLRALDPDGFTPTLLLDSHWCYRGRPVSIAEYNALMGFPRDYVYAPHDLVHQRKYLSKGVCPPVAAWVLDTIVAHLEGRSPARTAEAVLPGDTVNFNLKRKDVSCAA